MASQARLPIKVTLFGYILPLEVEALVVIVGFAKRFFVLAIPGLARTE